MEQIECEKKPHTQSKIMRHTQQRLTLQSQSAQIMLMT